MDGVPKTMRLGLKNTKIRCLSWSGSYQQPLCGLTGLTFSPESQFDYTYNGANLYVRYSALSHEAILEIFNQLPDFNGESERVIDIVGCLGVTELTEEDLKIATDKNWVVITK